MSALEPRPVEMAEPLRLLIVDDNPDDADLMRVVLEDEGFQLEDRRVDNAVEFVAALGESWDLILCDYSMPRFGTFEVLNLLRQHERVLPLVLVSGTVPDATVVDLMYRGVRHFVPKRNLRLLGPVVRRALECSRPLSPAVVPKGEASSGETPDWRRLGPAVDRLLEQARAADSRLALVSFDVDRFHRINHGLGYEHGEQLLRAIGERVAQLAGNDLYLGRVRGDEYLVAIKGAEAAEARVREVLTRLRRPYRIGGMEITPTFSAGVALFPDHGSESAALLREAEAAMFEAKRRGRGTYHFATSALARAEHVRLEHELYRALERNQFSLEYQPQVEMSTGRLLGVEALLRWNHPDLGRVPPTRFIPLAEESGEITRIGAWVLHTACRDAAAWRALPGGEKLRVAVNLSARQFLEHDIVALVKKTLDETHLDPAALDLELTESVLISDADEAANRLHLFRHMGVRTSVDDFGTGYSSLSYLRRFPLDVLKIDRSFVMDLNTDARAALVVEALINLGISLGMELIAEGVETQEQADALIGIGCHTAQGWLFGRPVAASAITALLTGGSAAS